MEFFRKMSESTGLVSGMAERLDVDLRQRLTDTPDQTGRSFLNMVMRCANCTEHDACAKLQDDNPALETAPAYCRNGDILNRR